GEVVISKLNKHTLSQVAQSTGGLFLNGKLTKEVVSSLISILEKMEKKEFETQVFSDYEDQFQWFLGLALSLLIIDSLILNRKTQWFKRLNLFEQKEDEKE